MITATEFRGNLYHLLDQALKTGEPIEIKRHGQILKVVPETLKPKKHKPLKLKKHKNVISCKPDELIHQDWISLWSENKS